MSKALALFAVVLLAGCGGMKLIPMRVIVEPPAYSVFMSSSLGLGLTPVVEAPPGMKIRHHWKTDEGYFLTQQERTAEIISLGTECNFDDGKLFWSYDPDSDFARQKRDAHITVTALSRRGDRELAATDIRLVWDGELVRPAH